MLTLAIQILTSVLIVLVVTLAALFGVLKLVALLVRSLSRSKFSLVGLTKENGIIAYY